MQVGDQHHNPVLEHSHPPSSLLQPAEGQSLRPAFLSALGAQGHIPISTHALSLVGTLKPAFQIPGDSDPTAS